MFKLWFRYAFLLSHVRIPSVFTTNIINGICFPGTLWTLFLFVNGRRAAHFTQLLEDERLQHKIYCFFCYSYVMKMNHLPRLCTFWLIL